LGVTRIIASGATGSLREEIRPRDLVVVDQVIDQTTHRAGTFFDEPGIAVHVEFAEPFCPALRRTLLEAAASSDLAVHDGATYVCMEGPAFSTIAESRMHRSWGGDLIGMTCLPEARLAREAEMCYALLALPTDYDCWRPHDPAMDQQALLQEILGNMEAATANCVALIKAALPLMASRQEEACPCRNALQLAIWTDRESISPETAQRYGILLSRHLKS
jgi:5'-methylthioadenosine phosphorylase